MNRFDIEFWNGMNKAALKASKLVEKAKSIEEARNSVKDLLKRIEDRIEAEIDTFLQYK
jgi:ABC-type sugar transport system substrate-binding protein